MRQPIYIHGGTVLSDGLAAGDILIEDGVIGEIDSAAPARAMMLDARGLFVLPGMVDVHGDAFERHIMPRPGVSFAMDLALVDADRALIANGITTAFHGVTVSWEPGLRSAASARVVLDTLAAVGARLAADTRVHLRHETFNLDGEPQVMDWLAEGRVGVIAFNDHMEQVVRSRNKPQKIATMVERSGIDAHDFMALADRTHARREEVPASVARIAGVARAAGVPMMSHDDTGPDMRRLYRAMGAVISEFPTTEDAAREAAAHGEPVVLGAPNVVRGGSHTGCVGAAEMVARGYCTVLASDYYYPALLLAPFALARSGEADFASAWGLVSRGPADALGLNDRGVIAPGRRGDLILVAPEPQPRVVATISQGRIVHLADGGILG